MKNVQNFESFVNEGKLSNLVNQATEAIDNFIDKANYKISREKKDILDAELYAAAAKVALEQPTFEAGMAVLKAIPEELKKRKDEILDGPFSQKASEIIHPVMNDIFDKWKDEMEKLEAKS